MSCLRCESLRWPWGQRGTQWNQIKVAIDDCRKCTNFANYTNYSTLIMARPRGQRPLSPALHPAQAWNASVFIKSAISGVHSPSRRHAAPLKVKHYENVIRQNFPEDCRARARSPPPRDAPRSRPPAGRGCTPAVASVRPRSSRARRRSRHSRPVVADKLSRELV